MEIQQTLAEHLRFMKGRHSEASISTRRKVLAPFFLAVKKRPQEITLADIEKYRGDLVGRGKLQMANMFCAHMKQLLRWLERFDVSEKITYKKIQRPIPVVLNKDEMTALVNESKKDIRTHAMVMTFMLTGVRLSELCSINVEDIDYVSKTIHIHLGKGGKDRMAIFDEELQPIILTYIEQAKPEHALFESFKGRRMCSRQVQRIIKGCALDAGIKKDVHPHMLRHSFATVLLANGTDIRYIQTLLGHAQISSTQIYTHVDTKKLSEAYQKGKPTF